MNFRVMLAVPVTVDAGYAARRLAHNPPFSVLLAEISWIQRRVGVHPDISGDWPSPRRVDETVISLSVMASSLGEVRGLLEGAGVEALESVGAEVLQIMPWWSDDMSAAEQHDFLRAMGCEVSE